MFRKQLNKLNCGIQEFKKKKKSIDIAMVILIIKSNKNHENDQPDIFQIMAMIHIELCELENRLF